MQNQARSSAVSFLIGAQDGCHSVHSQVLRTIQIS
ncbi:hypothetical protein AZE42_13190 [Rhizopogon vesiculosus]|uniref:Uncharacterized protein n=1 Tax=Rhizopogon vesiculosus TaxID=180088 RepID=A0A1J8PR52_9AGAM|nr:hypothetical protein AZE42_13190 [Rhizopogon vesiculosus]